MSKANISIQMRVTINKEVLYIESTSSIYPYNVHVNIHNYFIRRAEIQVFFRKQAECERFACNMTEGSFPVIQGWTVGGKFLVMRR